MRRLNLLQPKCLLESFLPSVSAGVRAHRDSHSACFVTSLLCVALPPGGVPRDSYLPLATPPDSADVSLLTVLREQQLLIRVYPSSAAECGAPSSPPPGSGLRQVFNLTSRHNTTRAGPDFRTEITPPLCTLELDVLSCMGTLRCAIAAFTHDSINLASAFHRSFPGAPVASPQGLVHLWGYAEGCVALPLCLEAR